MHSRYTALIIFWHVATSQSFTHAARSLGCSKAFVSKEISTLERETGALLFHRSTRSVKLTLTGEALFTHADNIVRELEQAEGLLAGLQMEPRGILRLTAPTGFSDYLLAPMLADLVTQYPALKPEVLCTGELLNLVEAKIDVAIRLTHEPPADRIAKRLGEYRMILCASPAYLAAHGVPSTAKALQTHRCLVYATEKHFDQWPFADTQITIKPVLSANNSKILLESALAGHGIARLPDYVVSESLRNGTLVPVLESFYPPPIPVYAIYARSRVIPAKIRVFVEHMQMRMRGI